MYIVHAKYNILSPVLSTSTASKCSNLKDPSNGKVYIIDNGGTALFICNSGFVTAGSPTSYCIDGNWSSPPPSCKRS